MPSEGSNPRSEPTRVALVTGGGTGIGRAIALSLASSGMVIVICGRRTEPLIETVATITSLGGRASHHVADVTSAEERAALVHDVEEQLGTIDVLVSSAAGQALHSSWLDWSEADWRAEVEVMALAGFALAQLLAPGMCQRHWGRLIFVGSVLSGLGVDPQLYATLDKPDGVTAVPYHAGKGALIGTMRALACALGSSGVTVNSLSPGMIATQGVDYLLDADVRRRIEERTPLHRFGRPEEVAAGAVFLASEEASFVNGHDLVVDGGWSAW